VSSRVSDLYEKHTQNGNETNREGKQVQKTNKEGFTSLRFQ